MSLLNFEKEYCKNLEKQYEYMEYLYKKIKSNDFISLEGNDITKAILFRMRTYYDTQEKICNFLNKRYSAPGADFFVEAIAFYLRLIIEKNGINSKVYSERQIIPRRGTIRPDISVWENDKVIAIIECKTQLGWNRSKWEENFKQREQILKSAFPKAKSFLVVMTSENWAGFPDDNKNVGKRYFTLSTIWPKKITEDNINSVIINPIEGLFKKIISKK